MKSLVEVALEAKEKRDKEAKTKEERDKKHRENLEELKNYIYTSVYKSLNELKQLEGVTLKGNILNVRGKEIKITVEYTTEVLRYSDESPEQEYETYVIRWYDNNKLSQYYTNNKFFKYAY